jgi:membrane protein
MRAPFLAPDLHYPLHSHESPKLLANLRNGRNGAPTSLLPWRLGLRFTLAGHRIASISLRRDAALEQLIGGFHTLLGEEGANTVRHIIQNTREQSGTATLVGIGTIVFGATGVFSELQEALNTMWSVTAKPGNDVKIFLRKRLFSFLMVLGIGLLLLSSLILGTATSAVAKYLSDSLPVPGVVLESAQFLVTFALTTLLFASIYKVLPDVKIAWSDVWTGAAVTAVLFNIGKTLIGMYLVNSTVASPYGAAGSLVLLLVWVYYSRRCSSSVRSSHRCMRAGAAGQSSRIETPCASAKVLRHP